MCYSGKCIWELHNGDCGFPTIPEVRNKYPYPLCTIGNDEENSPNFEEMIREVKELVKIHNNGIEK